MKSRRSEYTALHSRLLGFTYALTLLFFFLGAAINAPLVEATGLADAGDVQPNGREVSQDVNPAEEDTGLSNGVEKKSLARRGNETQFQGNNIATPYQVDPGVTTVWMYPNRFLELPLSNDSRGFPSALNGTSATWSKRRDLSSVMDRFLEGNLNPRQEDSSPRTIFISANTCRQPIWNGTGPQIGSPPQLTLYVANSPEETELGPNASNSTQQIFPFEQGFVNASVPNASGDWYFAVSSPDLAGTDFTGSWNYEIAPSTDAYFHGASPNDPFLFLVDTDLKASLMVTNNLTQANASSLVYQQWMNLTAPFIMFAANTNITAVYGVESSYCGMSNAIEESDQIQASQSDLEGTVNNVQMGMITRGLGEKPKQQFYLTDLNSSTSYTGWLAMTGNSTASGNGVVGGGGSVWAPVNFSTKADGNCQLMFNLSFCDQVAYAAPANPRIMPTFEDLQSFYDNYTSTWYQNFAYSLDQIPCNTTSAAQYSLAKNCSDCAAAYKQWLCAVSIPRCEDFSNPATYLQIRNVAQPFFNNESMLEPDFLLSSYIPMSNAPRIQGSNAYQQTYNWSFATNQSRNPAIDQSIMPGPYKELLPCEDLCYSLTQACPAALGFVCPYRGRGLEAGYGRRSSDGLTCSYLGAVYYMNDAGFARLLAGSRAVWQALVAGCITALTLMLAL